MTDQQIRERARQYELRIIPDAADQVFHARVPAMPGIITYGETPEEAVANGYEAIELAIEGLLAEGRLLPVVDTVSV